MYKFIPNDRFQVYCLLERLNFADETPLLKILNQEDVVLGKPKKVEREERKRIDRRKIIKYTATAVEDGFLIRLAKSPTKLTDVGVLHKI